MPVEASDVVLDTNASALRPAGPSDAGDSGRAGSELPPVAEPARPACGGSRRPRRIASDELFCGAADELEIVHGEWVYRLRRTAQGKLILTK